MINEIPERNVMDSNLKVSFQCIKEVEDWVRKPYEDKLELANNIIKEALSKSKKPAVAFSGGKNSLVVLYLVLQHKPDVIVNFNNTGVEYPGTVKYVRLLAKEWNLNYYEIKPKTTFWKVVKEHGLPTEPRMWGKYSREPVCCYKLKTEPVAEFYTRKGIDCYFTGISAFESRLRKFVITKFGLLRTVKKVGQKGRLIRPTLSCHPIALWTDLDVFRFIEENELPLNPAYDRYGVDRTGCFVCTNYKGWVRNMSRNFPRVYRLITRMMGQTTLEEFT